MKSPPASAGEPGSTPRWEGPGGGRGARSRTLAWRAPWAEEPGSPSPRGGRAGDDRVCERRVAGTQGPWTLRRPQSLSLSLSLPGEPGHLPTQSAAHVLYSPPRLISWALLLRATTFTPLYCVPCPRHARPFERRTLVINSPTLSRLVVWRSVPRPSLRFLASPQT